MAKNRSIFPIMTALTVIIFLVCVGAGSVSVPVGETASILINSLTGQPGTGSAMESIILSVRLPRVLCVLLIGSALALAGAGMQGLLRNPLADGSTLGVSSGAALGAVLAMWMGMEHTAPMAMLFGFGSLAAILTLAYGLDRSLSTHSIILLGVIFSMFCSALMSLLITFAGEKLRTITFWTMGSLAGANMQQAALVLGALIIAGGVLFACSRALDAFSQGEEHARQLGVNVGGVKLAVMAAASALVGVCVSVGGTIGFVGLVVPHMMRLILGPAHGKLLPMAMLGGGAFLMLCDLAARTVARPAEMPIGVVTSLIGAVFFVVIYYRARRGSSHA